MIHWFQAPQEISMPPTNQYHDRIARATKSLAQMQVRELLADQRRESRARNAAKREQAKRRQRVASIVFLAGAESIDDAELLGALLSHLDARVDPSVRQLVAERGEQRLRLDGIER